MSAAENVASNVAVYVAACGILLQLVGFFVMAWKNDKDKKDDSLSEDLSEIDRKVERIDATMRERDTRYNERFTRLERDINNIKK